MKNLFKEMVYLGLGVAVMTKRKTEKMLENLIADHQMTRDEGQQVVHEVMEKAKRAKEGTDEQIAAFVDKFSEKTSLAKEEISHLLKAIIEKPKKAKDQLVDKVEELAEKISKKTSMTVEQAKKMLLDFMDEVLKLKKELKKQGTKLSNKISKAEKKGKSFVHGIEGKSTELLNDMNSRLQIAMDKVLDRLQIAQSGQMQLLEKRITALEHQDQSK